MFFSFHRRTCEHLLTRDCMPHVQRHEKVSCCLAERFGRWQDSWKQENVTSEMETSYNDWLHGRMDGLKPGLVTVSNVTDDKTRPPYRNYTKYNVVVEQQAVEALAE